MILIDGKKAAAELRQELKKEVSDLKAKYNKVPGLTVILIGDLTPSQIYVRNKEKSANEVGLKSEVIKYPDSVEEKTVLDKIEELNKNEEFLLALTTNGYGKRSSAYEYRISNRGGKGITGILTSEKNGEVLDCFVIYEDDQIILVTDKGQIIRINVSQIRIAGRSTKGVSVFKIPEGDSIVSVSRIPDIDT